MRFAALVSLALCFSWSLPASAQPAQPEPFQMASTIVLPGGFRLHLPGERERPRRGVRERGAQRPPAGAWQSIAPVNGQGATVCNVSGDLYACLALRCGKGRGLEFAFLFNVGDYGSNPRARFKVDGADITDIAFSAVDPARELVAPYSPQLHLPLVVAMRAGRALEMDIGFVHQFSLKGSSAEIDRTFAACAGEIGGAQVAAAGPDAAPAGGSGDLRATIRRIIASYKPSEEKFDYSSLKIADWILKEPEFGNVDLGQFDSEDEKHFKQSSLNPEALSAATDSIYMPKAHQFYASPEHARLAKRMRQFKGNPDRDAIAELHAEFNALIRSTRERFGDNHPATAAVLESYLAFQTEMWGWGSREFQIPEAEQAKVKGQVADGFLRAARGSPFDQDIIQHAVAALQEQASLLAMENKTSSCVGTAKDDEIAAIWRKAAATVNALEANNYRILGLLRNAAFCERSLKRQIEYMMARAGKAAEMDNLQVRALTLADLGWAYAIGGEDDAARQSYREAFRLFLQSDSKPSQRLAFLVEPHREQGLISHIRTLRQIGLDAELDLAVARIANDFLANYDLSSTVGQSWALDTAEKLEESGRFAIADQFYAFVSPKIRGNSSRRSLGVNVASTMSAFAEGMIDTERYDLARGLLARALARAEASSDRAVTASILVQIARNNDESGDLDGGLVVAHRALREIKSSNLRLEETEQTVLNDMLSRAREELGRIDRVADIKAQEIDEAVRKVCGARENADKLFEAFPTTFFLSNSAFADALLAKPAMANFVRCFNQRRGELSGYAAPGAEQYSLGAAIGSVLYVLAKMEEHQAADELLGFLFDSRNWLASRSDSALLASVRSDHLSKMKPAERAAYIRVGARDGVIGALADAINGLRRAGKAAWIDPYLDRLPSIFDRNYILARNRYRVEVGDEAFSLGMELLASGHRDEAKAIFDAILADPSEDMKKRNSCLTVSGCEYFATMYDAFGQPDKARPFFEDIPSRFTVENSGANVSAGEADALTELAIETGLMHSQAGRHRLALAYFETAQAGFEYMSDLRQPLSNLATIQVAAATARAKYAMGETAAAHELTAHMLKAASQKLSGRTSPSSDELMRWSHRLRDIFEVHLDSSPVNAEGGIAGDAETFFAFQYLQSTRTAATIAKIAERAGGEGDDAVRRRQDIDLQLAELYDSLLPATGKGARRLIERIDRLEREKKEISTGPDADAAEAAGALALQFPPIEEVREKLGADDALLMSFSGSEHAYLWLVTSTESRLLRLEQRPAAIDAMVRRLRAAVQDFLETGSDEYATKSWPMRPFREPYEVLLAPFDDLLSGVDRLYFVPNGAFDSLPLSVLLVSEPSKPEMTAAEIREARLGWAVRKFAVNVLPSVQSLSALASSASQDSQQQRPFLGVGNPDFGAGIRVAAATARSLTDQLIEVPPLPDTQTEIARIADILAADPARDLLVGANASEGVLREMDLKQYRVINFATHGILAGQLRGVDEPALILSIPKQRGGQDDGVLKASEIANYKLDADLVILSACNTAGSDGTPGAEGLSGLANAFFYAGARNLVVTHWEIPSAPAVEIATGMIEAHAQTGDADWAGALRRSVIAMIDGKGPPEFAHPAAWGAHMVVGASTR